MRITFTVAMISFLFFVSDPVRAGVVVFEPVAGMTESFGPPFPTAPVAYDVYEASSPQAIERMLLSIIRAHDSGGWEHHPMVDSRAIYLSSSGYDNTGWYELQFSVSNDMGVSILNPVVREDDSFSLSFASRVNGLGTVSHTLHWEALQGLDFESYSVSQSAMDAFILSIELRGSFENVDPSKPTVRATVSGNFSAIPEPSSLSIFAISSLALFGCNWRRSSS